jgi:Rieske 2Fe-2S family protein
MPPILRSCSIWPRDGRGSAVGGAERAVRHGGAGSGPKERYFDPDFYRAEVERLWPRVWQMACRLEEIPEPHDFVEYEILDQSVIVVRGDDTEVRAFHNACRHWRPAAASR